MKVKTCFDCKHARVNKNGVIIYVYCFLFNRRIVRDFDSCEQFKKSNWKKETKQQTDLFN